jgi:hypothetical protein
MSKPKKEDIDKQGGWLVRVKKPPSLDRLLCVYELDWARAKELANAKARVDDGATVEAVGPMNVHSLTVLGMKPGDVLQHD